MNARVIVNSITLSRIPLSLLFIIFFQPNIYFLYCALIICGVAFISDILDGFLARKFNIASVHGRHWDSLGDKAFYIAVIISFNSHGLLEPIVCWGLLLREVALYITRIWYIEKLEKLELIRPYTNWHGYFMYLTIILGFCNMYRNIYIGTYPLYLYIQISAYIALLFGTASIFKFLSIK